MSNYCTGCGSLIDDTTYIDTYTREPLCWSCKHDIDAQDNYDPDEALIESTWHNDGVDEVLDAMEEEEVMRDIGKDDELARILYE
jgi:hypothetical protein